jgi:hypothetical protein
VGTFSITELKVAYFGAGLKGAGFGKASGFSPQSGDTAVVGNVEHKGFWTATKLTQGQQSQLHARAMALLPKTVPPNNVMPQSAGKTFIPCKATEQTYVFDFNRDGCVEAFIEIRVPLTLSSGTRLPDGIVTLIALYDRKTNSWIPILSSVFSGEPENLFGQPLYELQDVLDIDGDDRAEIVLSKAVGEGSDLEIYRFQGNQLLSVSKIEGWMGS